MVSIRSVVVFKVKTVREVHTSPDLGNLRQFGPGEALFAGGFAPVPTTVRARKRLTHEGGRDVGVPLRE